MPSGVWRNWLVMSGRGFGKTRIGSEIAIRWYKEGKRKRIALVGSTASDVRDIMIEGESGILTVSHPNHRPIYEPSKKRLTWPNGMRAYAYTAEEPDGLRGPQHDGALCDELAKWKYPQDTWDNLQMGLRLGDNPQCVITTTPKPIKTLKDIIADPETVITRGSTMENRHNIAPSTLRYLLRKYQGTRLGRQELDAELLDDNPNALWMRKDIDDYRVNVIPNDMRIVVSVDPAPGSSEDSDETGIIVYGRDGEHGYVLDDVTTPPTAKPNDWADAAIAAFHKHHANIMVAEVNNGADLVEALIRVRPGGQNIPFEKVWASKGKVIRAEPTAGRYEQGKVHHVGTYGSLEDELCTWETGMKSPNRLDALVWGDAYLFPVDERLIIPDSVGLIEGLSGWFDNDQ